MSVRILSIIVAGWLVGAPGVHALELSCPDGAKDSGYAHHQLARWCMLDVDGRLFFHGPLLRWHRNGNPATKEYFIRGERDGDFTSWWESGGLQSTGSYARGEPAGTWTFWDEEGRITSTVTYTAAGAMREDFHPNGNRRVSGTLRDNAKIGWWFLYDPDREERARCDFGDGLLTPPEDPDCQLISEEVEPAGFAPPSAKAKVARDGTATISLGSQSYAFTTPPGWVADAASGLSEGLALVFVPSGTAWRKSGRDMYVRAIARFGRPLQDVIDKERVQIAQRVGEYEEFALPPREGSLGPVEAKTLSYTRVEHRDSPVFPGATRQMREAVAYISASPEVALVVTLICDHRMKMKDTLPAFLALIESPRLVPPEPARK